MGNKQLSVQTIISVTKIILGESDYLVKNAFILPNGGFYPLNQNLNNHDDANIKICEELFNRDYDVDDFLNGEYQDNLLDLIGAIRIKNTDDEISIKINKVKPTTNSLASLTSWIDYCFSRHSEPITVNTYNYDSVVFSPERYTSENIINSIINFYTTHVLEENYFRVLYEDIESVKKNYPNIDDETFDILLNSDPTFKGNNSVGKYTKWILNQYKKNNIKVYPQQKFVYYHNDDLGNKEIRQLLSDFTDASKNKEINKDINSYKTPYELYNTIKNAEDKELTKRQIDRNKRKSTDIEKVFENKDWTIYVPKTYEASCTLGAGSGWCTADTRTDNYYNDYLKLGGKYYVIVSKSNPKEKYQIHFESKQFFGSGTNPGHTENHEYSLSYDEFVSDKPEIKEFFSSLGYDGLSQSITSDECVDAIVATFGNNIDRGHVYADFTIVEIIDFIRAYGKSQGYNSSDIEDTCSALSVLSKRELSEDSKDIMDAIYYHNYYDDFLDSINSYFGKVIDIDKTIMLNLIINAINYVWKNDTSPLLNLVRGGIVFIDNNSIRVYSEPNSIFASMNWINEYDYIDDWDGFARYEANEGYSWISDTISSWCEVTDYDWLNDCDSLDINDDKKCMILIDNSYYMLRSFTDAIYIRSIISGVFPKYRDTIKKIVENELTRLNDDGKIDIDSMKDYSKEDKSSAINSDELMF